MLQDHDEFNEDFESEEGQTTTQQTQANSQADDKFRKMREKANQADALARERAELQKENTLLKLGLDPEQPTVKLFLKAHDDFSDIEAVKTAMQEYGILPTQADAQAQADQAALQRVSQASTSGAPAQPVATGPDWGSMKTEAEVIAAVAAAGGTVIFD